MTKNRRITLLLIETIAAVIIMLALGALAYTEVISLTSAMVWIAVVLILWLLISPPSPIPPLMRKIKVWRHLRARDRLIIKRAKESGSWDIYPICLGGRALELKAWQDFRIKREYGEPDAHLRRRYMDAAEK